MEILAAISLTSGVLLICFHYLFRKRSQEFSIRIRKLRVSVRKNKVRSFAYIEAKFLVELFESRLGHPLSLKAFASVTIASFLFTALYVQFMGIFRYLTDEEWVERIRINDNFIEDTAYTIFANALGNAPWDWVSYAATFYLLIYMVKHFKMQTRLKGDLVGESQANRKNKIFFLKIVVIDVVLVFVISLLALQSIYSLHDIYYYSMYGEIRWKCNADPIQYSNAILKAINFSFEAVGENPPFPAQCSFHFLTIIIPLTGAVFTLAHIFVAFAFSANKIIPSFIYEPTFRILSAYAKARMSTILFMGSSLILLSNLLTVWAAVIGK